MIDTWSLVHALLVVAVCSGQVYFLRGLFDARPSVQGTKARA